MLDCFVGLMASLACWIVSFSDGGVGSVSRISGVVVGKSASYVGGFSVTFVVS